MKHTELMQLLEDELNKIPKEFQPLQEPFCAKCGVAIEFHMNLYCRKIQGLTKGIIRLKQQLAIAKKNEHHD
jgi:hypothetical protein